MFVITHAIELLCEQLLNASRVYSETYTKLLRDK